MNQETVGDEILQTMTRSELVLNYLWQLRPYSYADLVLVMLAFHATGIEIISASCLWFGFLIHLEWRHRDRGRQRWPWGAWVVVWVVGVLLAFKVASFLFLGLAMLYSLKKRVKFIAPLSFVLNGGIKGSLVATLAGVGPAGVVLVTLLMAIRNLAGDVRDAGKDSDEGVLSLPVRLGYHRNTRFVYPLALVATSVVWTIVGKLPLWVLASALVVEAATYSRTPR